MPFKSKAQQRFMFAAESRGEVPKGTAKRWARHTKSIKKLPEKVAEEVLLKVSKDLIPGGKASGKTDADYDERQIQMGAEVEKEHTPDSAKTHEIARDHLEEFPNYYTELAKMEDKLKQQKEGACATPGMKIRSKGKGRGLARGKGAGPLGKSASELADLAIKRAAELTEETRSDIPTGEFALPGRRYPIHDKAHAENALARVSQHGSPGERKTVRQKVYSAYPELKASFKEREGESPTSKKNISKEKLGAQRLAVKVAEEILKRHAR